MSGLPVDRFCFEGFLPRKAGERRRVLEGLAGEAAHDGVLRGTAPTGGVARDLAAAFGADRAAAVCRELTKTYEEVRRGGLGELADWAAGEVRGEITLVVAGAEPAVSSGAEPAVLAAAVFEAESAGTARKDAIAAVARAHGLPKRAVFDAVVAAKASPTSRPVE